MKFNKVIMHPIVLLTVLDHYKRAAFNTKKRVFGVLLGNYQKEEIDVTNCFAIPYEENHGDSSIWFFDFLYAEEMANMFKKIASERVVGFYSSGPELRNSDLEIEKQFKKLSDSPIYVIVDIRCINQELPAKSYYVEETIQNGNIVKTFRNITTIIGASAVEEVGVEHLLRDVNDPLLTTLSSTILSKIKSLSTMEKRLFHIISYLELVLKGKMEANPTILGNIQEILNQLPHLHMDKLDLSLYDKTNDINLLLLVGNILKSLTSLYDVINNHLEFINS